MTRRPKAPLRILEEEERHLLEQLSRAQSQPASHVIRAKLVLSVADGQSYTAAAHSVGRRSGDAVSQLVARFNQEGIRAIAPRHAGGPMPIYEVRQREQILKLVQRSPDRAQDGTASWSLMTLREHLRRDGNMPNLSTYTIWHMLRQAGWSWQQSRTWCSTGQVLRRRKGGIVEVTDPDSAAKKQ